MIKNLPVDRDLIVIYIELVSHDIRDLMIHLQISEVSRLKAS